MWSHQRLLRYGRRSSTELLGWMSTSKIRVRVLPGLGARVSSLASIFIPASSLRHRGRRGDSVPATWRRGAPWTTAEYQKRRRKSPSSGVRRFGRYTRRAYHSGLIPANLITLPHFSVSSAMSLPKSAADPGSTAPPRSASRAFILGSASAALISLLSLSTISAGVFLGAPMPNQELAS